VNPGFRFTPSRLLATLADFYLRDLGFDWFRLYDDGHVHGDIRNSGAHCTPTGMR